MYFTSATHEVVAVRKLNGAVRWTSQSVGNAFPIGTALKVAGSVVLYPEIHIYAFDAANGRLKWTYRDSSGSAGGFYRLAVDSTAVYGGSNVGVVVAVDIATGAARWRTKVSAFSGQVNVFEPLLLGGLVYVAYRNQDVIPTGALVALSAATGAEVWRRDLTSASPALGGGGVYEGLSSSANRIVAVSFDGQVRAFTLDSGQLVWTSPRPSAIPATSNDVRPLTVVGNVAIVGSSLDLLTGLDAQTGAQIWSMSGQHVGVSLFLPITPDGDSFLLQFGGQVARGIAASGITVWSTKRPPEPAVIAPPIADSLYVFVGSDSGLYALRR